MTAQKRHDAIRRIARDPGISDGEALHRIAMIAGPADRILRDIEDIASERDAELFAAELLDLVAQGGLVVVEEADDCVRFGLPPRAQGASQ